MPDTTIRDWTSYTLDIQAPGNANLEDYEKLERRLKAAVSDIFKDTIFEATLTEDDEAMFSNLSP